MKQYDVIFLHAPRILTGSWSNLKQKVLRRLGLGTRDLIQYCQLPMGIFSLAASLDDGYDVKIINLGLEQKFSHLFSLERYVKSLNAKIFAIDLQWFVHIASALKLAEVCKRYHPNSKIVLGGMTATWFHDQIFGKYPYVDAVLRGEADFSMPQLAAAYCSDQEPKSVEGLTYRQGEHVKQTPIGKIPEDIDALVPTRIELLDKWEKYLHGDVPNCGEATRRFFWLPIIRGCPYNCAHCGGGHHSYRLLTGRNNVIFRSTEKVAEDIQIMQEKGVEVIYFSHDLETMGRKRYLDLFKKVKNRGIDLSAYVESFRFPSKEFVEKFAETFPNPIVVISPESFSEDVRRRIGREFSNHDLFKSLENLRKEEAVAVIYFTIGLPGDVATYEWFESFKKFVEKLSDLGARIIPPQPYTIDPNCLLAIDKERYGIRLLLKTLEDYKRICYSLDPIDKIGHETESLSQQDILNLTSAAYKYTVNYYTTQWPKRV